MKKTLIATALAVGLSFGIGSAAPAAASEGGAKIPTTHWSFNGPLGTYDRGELQRGWQVYREVCAACHSMNLLAYRNLADLGYNEAEVKAFAAAVTVKDGPDDQGEMFERPGLPSDKFKSPFPNVKAAMAANNGAAPPDLSLMAKARAGGPDYIHALLTGYSDAPAGITILPGLNYNKYFPGNAIAMPAPLADGAVTYADGTKSSVDQMAHDVSAFLMWAAEPKLEARHQLGAKVVLFLILLTILLYVVKRKVWADVH